MMTLFWFSNTCVTRYNDANDDEGDDKDKDDDDDDDDDDDNAWKITVNVDLPVF